jgi:hypothetical protein
MNTANCFIRFCAKTSNIFRTMASDSKTKIAICQLTCTSNKEANLEICRNLIEKAKVGGAQVDRIILSLLKSRRIRL